MRKLKAHYGISDILMNDNGPQYTAQTFKLSECYEFQHITSSPGYIQSDGKAESDKYMSLYNSVPYNEDDLSKIKLIINTKVNFCDLLICAVFSCSK